MPYLNSLLSVLNSVCYWTLWVSDFFSQLSLSLTAILMGRFFLKAFPYRLRLQNYYNLAAMKFHLYDIQITFPLQ